MRHGPLAAYRWLTVLSLLGACSGSPALGQSAPAPDFEECETRVRSEPPGYEPFVCFYWVAARTRDWEEAARRLDRLRRTRAETAWPILVRAHVDLLIRGDAQAAWPLYEEAAERFSREGDALGEVLARFNLRAIYRSVDDAAGAARQVDLAFAAAQRGDSAEAKLRALVLQADHLTSGGGELDRAYRALRRAKDLAFPEGPLGIQQTVLRQLALVSYDLGFTGEAIDYYEELLELKRSVGDTTEEALVLFNILAAKLRALEELPRMTERPALLADTRSALARARELSDHVVTARLEALLGDLLSDESPTESRVHYRRCHELAVEHQQDFVQMVCALSFARHLADVYPEAARAYGLEASELALASENDLDLSYVWEARQRTAFASLPIEDAVAESRAGLAAIERLRTAQGAERAQIGLFSTWTRTYYWLAGTLLSGDRPDLATGFELAERMRARSLFDRVGFEDEESASDSEPPGLVELRAEIASIQRRLVDPSTNVRERTLLVDRLEKLELEEADRRFQDRSTGNKSFRPIGLEALQRQLTPDEAMLAFLVGLDEDIYGEFGGGAFVFAITSQTVEVFPIPDRVRLATSVPVFVGLLSSPASSLAAQRSLSQRLLGLALESLPNTVERLILVPDGPLHQLPFAALPTGEDSAPLGLRFELSSVPSATLWAIWRESREAVPRQALVLADPDIGVQPTDAAATTRSAVFAQGLEAGRLPNARDEGAAIVRVLRDGELWLDDHASERRLKDVELDAFGVLHFAAHAFADESRPDRAGILLAPGAEDEDGLLQAREIVGFELDRKMVVLSACQTAAGTTVSGEGVLSLARSFFAAGASTVVASRWPLRDDHAEIMFAAFYRAVAEGASAAAALRRAQQRAVERGLPAESWAGVVLLGSGDFRLPEPPARPDWWWLGGLVVVIASAIVALEFVRRRAA